MKTRFEYPVVGKEVIVTCSIPDSFIRATKPTQEFKIRGVVQKTHRLTPRDYLVIDVPGSEVPVREIAPDLISSIEYVNGAKVPERVTDDSIISVNVPGSKGAVYTVLKSRSHITCSCPGFQFRRHCKHIINL